MGTKKPYDTVKVKNAFTKYVYRVTAYGSVILIGKCLSPKG
jgi:hypothetical protein